MAILFIVLQMLFAPFAQLNHNTSSRLAAMAAFCENGNFEISAYRGWTDDWAQTPDGKLYSNKAPGGLILGTPVFCAARWVQHAMTSPSPTVSEATRVASDWKLRYAVGLLLCLLLQIIPWVLLCRAWDFRLKQWGVSSLARLFCLVALLFGTTAAILQDVWMGHGLVALFSLGALLALVEERPALLGFSLGMAVLTDYSAAFLLPVTLICLSPGLRRPRALGIVALGALAPAIAWVTYHQSCFGSPFAIANRFQNPMFQDRASESIQLWGILGLPRPRILGELLFGWKRGILFSQPWIFCALALPLFVRLGADSRLRRIWIFSSANLALLLLMNASFGGWHGGASTGPRYLSAALPLFAIAMALGWEGLPRRVRRVSWLGLGFAGVVFALGKIIGPTVGLWPEFADQWSQRPFEITWKALLFVAISGGFWLIARRELPRRL